MGCPGCRTATAVEVAAAGNASAASGGIAVALGRPKACSPWARSGSWQDLVGRGRARWRVPEGLDRTRKTTNGWTRLNRSMRCDLG